MPILPKQIEKYVDDGKELFWYRPRRDVLQLRVVTYTYENGNFRSRALWTCEPFNDEAIDKAKKMHDAILAMYPERARHSALNDLRTILNSMWFDGVIKQTPYPEFKTEQA